MVHIREGVDIEENELRFSFSRSSGPGGQNVNKVDTRVTLVFDLMGSGSLATEQKAELRRRLASHLNPPRRTAGGFSTTPESNGGTGRRL